MRLSEFKTTVDTLEEYIENEAQIEVAREYEMKPKPTLIATKEFLNKNIFSNTRASIITDKCIYKTNIYL